MAFEFYTQGDAGIRPVVVTGSQNGDLRSVESIKEVGDTGNQWCGIGTGIIGGRRVKRGHDLQVAPSTPGAADQDVEIGRAPAREARQVPVVAGSFEKKNACSLSQRGATTHV